MSESDLNKPVNYVHAERCSDGGCVLRNPKVDIGMQTNGGLHCLDGLPINKRMAIRAGLREVYKYANKESNDQQ